MTTPLATSDPGDVIVGLEALTIADAMRSFVDSGLIDLLDRLQPVTIDDLAHRAHIAVRPIALLFAVLREVGVVDKAADGTWRVSGRAADWKVVISGSVVAPFLDAGCGAKDIGDPANRHDVGREYRSTVGVLAEIVRPVAAQWSKRLSRPGLRMLEVAAGAAPWTRAMLQNEPTAQATMLDLAPIIELHGPALVAAHPDADISLVSGDVFDVELTGPFDLIVVSGFCRLFDSGSNGHLFRRVASWLAPSGTVVVADAVAVPGQHDRSLAVYELSLAARAAAGRIYTIDDFDWWLQSAGLSRASAAASGRAGITVLTATKGQRVT